MLAIFGMIRDFMNNKNMRLFVSRSDKILNLFSFGKAEQLIGAESVSAKLNHAERLVVRTALEAASTSPRRNFHF